MRKKNNVEDGTKNNNNEEVTIRQITVNTVKGVCLLYCCNMFRH
jgi:hypothetical protein